MATTVMIVGAGATIAEAYRLDTDPKPPLDKGFFAQLKKDRPRDLRSISNYMRRHYDIDITDPLEDGLEAVMSVIYTDVWNEKLASQAGVAFRGILRAINAQLAKTTELLPGSLDSTIAQVLLKTRNDTGSLDDISIITFNYDMQIEKALEALELNGISTSSNVTLNFPYCYGLFDLKVTSPASGSDLFTKGSKESTGVRLYKLHGSVNWYSNHISRSPSVSALLKKDRTIRITRRRNTTISMTYTGRRSTYTYPVIVPPVLNKSAILPKSLSGLWSNSERELEEAEHIIILGYSCPRTDYEAANLLARSLRNCESLKSISIIDPNPSVVERYAKLCRAARISYFSSIEAYLS